MRIPMSLAAFALLLPLAAASLTPEEGRALLFQLEADFARATAERGSEGFPSYLAEDASIGNPGRPFIRGRAAIAQTLPPGPMALTWKPIHAEMAASGDLGYTFGYWEARGKDKEGKEVVRYGKYVTIWKKQADGAWKVVYDGGNDGPDPKDR